MGGDTCVMAFKADLHTHMHMYMWLHTYSAQTHKSSLPCNVQQGGTDDWTNILNALLFVGMGSLAFWPAFGSMWQLPCRICLYRDLTWIGGRTSVALSVRPDPSASFCILLCKSVLLTQAISEELLQEREACSGKYNGTELEKLLWVWHPCHDDSPSRVCAPGALGRWLVPSGVSGTSWWATFSFLLGESMVEASHFEL